MLITSIQTLPETRHFPPHLIPSGIHWRNYPDALNSAPFGRFFLNSFIVTGASVVGNLRSAAWPGMPSRGCGSSAETCCSSCCWRR
jgi:multiple sugar transport system permease protein